MNFYPFLQEKSQYLKKEFQLEAALNKQADLNFEFPAKFRFWPGFGAKLKIA
jgi:hypothetical protein